ncbi:MAG: aminotransferase class I/II-fold pyridoxal phosphate-dependent enzyme [Bacteroidaceae bacterium]|nr:aminotransferase class I/II-fold pyridoxal phosphate-dependent enzyme [Bacteroidaceae bacterium]
MIQFQCDYNEGAHPLIIKRLTETNMEQTVGYGEDPHCEEARRLIKQACQSDNADVHFLVGGTQANTTVIAHILRPYQGVLAATSGHINVHETGAIESTGHKVLAIPTEDGKLTAKQIDEAMQAHIHEDGPEHMVQPGMVYLSFPTEIGTIYSHDELKAIRTVCNKYDLPLFVDGARLGYGLCSPECDLTLPQLAQLADVFYIGGTKVGALFGEAVVIMNEALKRDFRYSIKQHGGMLAKGRLLGLQFATLFTGNLYFDIAQHAIDEAMRIKAALQAKGIGFLIDSPTNQQFPIFTDTQIATLSEHFMLSLWQRIDEEHTAMRICTSWGTKRESTDALIRAIENL